MHSFLLFYSKAINMLAVFIWNVCRIVEGHLSCLCAGIALPAV